MKPLIAVSIFAMTCGVSFGEEQLVREIRWSEIQEASEAFPGEVKHGDGSGSKEYVVVTNSEDLPMSVSLLTLADPGITATQYALTGSVSYDAVQGTGYLEMWNHFPNGGAYFSKTLGDSGPMGSLRGSSSWRPFSLPFMSDEETGVPNKLVFNLVLPGPGTVKLADLRLVEYPDGFAAVSHPGAWWSDRNAGWIGAIGGVIFGVLGGLVGVLTGFGLARRFVFALSVAMLASGVTCLMLGIVAVSVSQPWGVWYPLLLSGSLCTILFGALLLVIRWRYQQIEIRRMASMDVDALHA